MEVQTECIEPPAATPSEAQPTGKINKAAFKLFGKRRSGTGMAGFFSFRNKGANGTPENGNSSANGSSSAHGGSAAELVRSKTHDGLTNAETERQRGEEPGGQEAGPVRSLSKSLSFFSLFRRGSARTVAENGGGPGFGRRGRGLKGLFSSMRWRRRDRAIEAPVEVLEAKEVREGDARGPEEGKDVTLTLEPPPPQREEDRRGSETETSSANAAAATPPHCFAMATAESPPPYTPTGSPLCGAPPAGSKAAVSGVRATPPLERCGAGVDPPSEPSVDRLCSLLFTDVTSLKSFDSLTGCGDIIADAEEEGVGPGGSGTSSSSSGGNAGGNAGGSPGGRAGIAAAAMSRGSPVKAPAHVSAPLPLPTFAPTPSPASLPSRARVAPPPPHPAGSGVVAYMEGGEEMASPEGVDDADMQGLWHMLPSTGDNSPALPRTQPNPAYPTRSASNPARGAERRAVQVKALGLSKIPVVGSGGRAGKPAHARHATSPYEMEVLSNEGYWDTPMATPTATPDEGGSQRNHGMGLSRDSCSGDHLYDLYNDPEEDQEEGEGGEEDLTSTPSPSTDCKLSPGSQVTPPSSTSSSSFRSVKGSASLPRDSKIPVSARQNTPPHSVSQTALSSVLEADTPPPKTEAPPTARTRIPVSKVPVRRAGNKPGNATRGSAHRK